MNQAKRLEIKNYDAFNAWRQVKVNPGTHGIGERTTTEYEGTLMYNLYKLRCRMSFGSFVLPLLKG